MTVTDKGLGIEEGLVPTMFDMFTRFDAVGERAGTGGWTCACEENRGMPRGELSRAA